MKRILLFFLMCILNGSFISTSLAAEIDSSGSEKNQFDSLEKLEEIAEDSDLKIPNNLQKGVNLFEQTEKQELLLPSQSVVEDPPFLENLQVSSELSKTAEAVAFSSVDTVVESQNRVKNQFQNEKDNSSNQFFTSFEKQEYIVQEEPNVQVQPIVEKILSATINESEFVLKSSPEELKKTALQHEDIPSFSEWTQKQLAEAEKKKTEQNETIERLSKTRGKFRNKNYASPDCGAKIVAANPESLSSSAVLSSLKDEYMLNYCTSRIWFVVELCEAIQAKQLDLANFELFSSSPKHFSVFVSLRFPTREWSNVGKFTAQDSRDVQTFNLNPHLFGKFVKVELHSHYSREQFCPISWVGIYGTSEYEVLAKEDEQHSLPDEDDPYEEDLFIGHRRDSPKNLFSSATDAVLSIVKKATAPFMKIDNNDTKSESFVKSFDSKYPPCVSPRYIIVCNNCSQNFYDEVFHVVSCQNINLDQLILNSFVKRTLINSEMCTKFGLDFNSLRTGAPFPSNYLEHPKQKVNYLKVMLKNSVVAALCNVLAVSENKVVANATVISDQTLQNVTVKIESCDINSFKSEIPEIVKPSTHCGIDYPTPLSFSLLETSIFTNIFKSTEQFIKKIEPTKTLTEDEVKKLPASNLRSESMKMIEETATDLFSSSHVMSTATMSATKKRFEAQSSTLSEHKFSFIEARNDAEKKEEEKNNSANNTNSNSTLESIFGDMNAIEKVEESPSSSFVIPSASNLPAESIFLRLANRIENLEINISLISTYLEELSKRYRVQLELPLKTLNLTIEKIEERLKANEEKNKKIEEEIILHRMLLANLTRAVSTLLRENSSWQPRTSSVIQHMFFISLEILLAWKVFNYWKIIANTKNSAQKYESVKKVTKKLRRRNGSGRIRGHETLRGTERRSSDETLEIALPRKPREDIFKMENKKRWRKKDSKYPINVIQLKTKKSDAITSEIIVERIKPTRVSEETQIPEFIPNDEVEISSKFAPHMSSPKFLSDNNSACKAFQSLSSPTFIKTTLAARNSKLKLASDRESSREQSVVIKANLESTKKERKDFNGLKST